LNAAIDDDLIPTNPASKLGRQLRLVAPVSVRQEEIKAMTRSQLEVFLDTTLRVAPGYHSLFLLLARTGVRIGEAIALQWPDINVVDREIRVERGFSARKIDTPKTGHGRTVDMSQQLARVLKRLQVDRKSETLQRGWPEVPPWVFCNAAAR
jgi:integrase